MKPFDGRVPGASPAAHSSDINAPSPCLQQEHVRAPPPLSTPNQKTLCHKRQRQTHRRDGDFLGCDLSRRNGTPESSPANPLSTSRRHGGPRATLTRATKIRGPETQTHQHMKGARQNQTFPVTPRTLCQTRRLWCNQPPLPREAF